jgi:hypothetical protein
VAALIALKTSRIRLVLAVMVAPHRPAVLAAKGGRPSMCYRAGVSSSGSAPAGCRQIRCSRWTARFAARDRATDEYLTAFRDLWTAEAPGFEGDWVKYGEIDFGPKPRQRPHPPIWIDRLRRLTAEAGREPERVELCYRVKRCRDAPFLKASDGQRRFFSGSNADIIGDFVRFARSRGGRNRH